MGPVIWQANQIWVSLLLWHSVSGNHFSGACMYKKMGVVWCVSGECSAAQPHIWALWVGIVIYKLPGIFFKLVAWGSVQRRALPETPDAQRQPKDVHQRFQTHLLFSAFYYHLLYLTRQPMICAISYSQSYGPNQPQTKKLSR